MILYFKGVKSEWGKITWPERKQVFVETLIVLAVVFFFTVLIYTLDIVFCIGLHPNNICAQCLHPNNKEKCSK
ncbi:MAG: preprotein translocase subunit SecE [bacterium]